MRCSYRLRASRWLLQTRRPTGSQRAALRLYLILFSLGRNAVAGPLDAKDTVVALAELPGPTGWCHAK